MQMKILAFDLDGTILDSLPSITDALNQTRVLFSLPPMSQQEVSPNVGFGLQRLIELTVAKVSIREEFAKKYEQILIKETKTAKIFPGVIEVMNYCRTHNILTAVISNQPQAAVDSFVETYKDLNFDYAIGVKPGMRPKPEIDMFQEFALTNGAVISKTLKITQFPYEVKVENLIYLGDTEVDFELSKNLGCRCILMSYGFRGRELISKYGVPVVDNMLDVIQFLV